MAYKTWKDLGFRIDKTSLLVDLTAYTNQATLAGAIKIIDQTALSDGMPVKITGLSQVTVDVNGYWNSTVEGVLGPCIDGTSISKTVEFKSYTGKFFNGEFWPSNIKVSGKVEDTQLWSASLTLTGALNRTAVVLP